MATDIDLPAAARAEALFTSDLSAFTRHTQAGVEAAIRRAIRAHGGIRGCAGAMAAAYGEHPETAAPRMRWARAVAEGLQAAGMVAQHLPYALRRRGCESVQYVAERNTHNPVLLVDGYAGTESVWVPLRQALAEAGFGHIIGLTYNSIAADPVTVSAELTHRALQAAADAGARRIHLIGHSLGGLIVRFALVTSAALSSQTGSAVTIASPHRGARLARIAPGRCARIMHRVPGSFQPEINAPRPIRWLAYSSDTDRVVSPASARLDDPRYGAANFLIPDCGHLTICRDIRLTRSLVLELIRTETYAHRAVSAGVGRAPIAA